MGLSSNEEVFVLILGVVWAAVGYRLAERFQRRYGVALWRIPAGVWALFWFLSVVLGAVLYLIARSTTLKRLGAGSYGGSPPYPQGYGGWPVSPTGPPGSGPGAGLGYGPGTGLGNGGDPTGPVGNQLPVSPPAWHPDPSGRFAYRWWDGTAWTSTVWSDGRVMEDTSPDQRIGPY
ncbi:MAG: DUF2510 domain-containing protein [Actinomycetota bacterium]|nr:DUF2510 domain-containing protein [Actinomycetota bacterium]